MAEFSADNTSMHFSNRLGGIVFSKMGFYEQFTLTCPAGEVINNDTQGQFLCQGCPSVQHHPPASLPKCCVLQAESTVLLVGSGLTG